MKLSTGKVKFDIEFDNGEKTAIYFNPQDRGIQDRIKAFEKSVEKKINEINVEKYKSKFNENVSIDIDLENIDIDKLLEMQPEKLQELQNRLEISDSLTMEANKVIRDELDVVFNSKVSDVIFKYGEPLDEAVLEDENGEETREIYIMHFLKEFAKEMKRYGLENKSAMDKHLKKYAK